MSSGRSILDTERLHLRELSLADAPWMLELLNEPAWLRFVGDKGVRTNADAERYLADGPIAMYARHGFGPWAVVRKADATCLGVCGVLKREALELPDLGYGLFARHEGCGYGREAASATLAHARDTLGLRRLLALTAAENGRSIRVLTEIGFRFGYVRLACATFRESKVYVWGAEENVG